MKLVATVGIGVGVVLLLLSTVWGNIFAGTSKWTDEKAARSAEIKARLPYLGAVANGQRKASSADVQKAKAEFEALTSENEQLNDEFTAAAETPHTIARILKWSGISLAVAGLVGWYAANQSR